MFPILNHSICLQLCDINSAKNGNSTSKGRVWQNMDDNWKNCNRAYKELKKAALQCNGSEFDQLTMLANSFNVHYSVTTVHGVATSLKLVVGWFGTHGWMDWLWFVGGNSEHSLKLVHLLLLIFLSQIVGFCKSDCSDNFANIWI